MAGGFKSLRPSAPVKIDALRIAAEHGGAFGLIEIIEEGCRRFTPRVVASGEVHDGPVAAPH
jgi:hypothetical protein